MLSRTGTRRFTLLGRLSGRSWQDWTFAVGNLVLSAGLVPALFDAQKPPVSTAATIVPVLCLFAVAEWTLKLKLSTAATLAQIAMWAALAGQRMAQ